MKNTAAIQLQKLIESLPQETEKSALLEGIEHLLDNVISAANWWQNNSKSLSKLPFQSAKRIYDVLFDGYPIPIPWMPKKNSSSNIKNSLDELKMKNYSNLYNWSITDKSSFWQYAIEKIGIQFSKQPKTILNITDGPEHPIWLENSKFNIAENCFRATGKKPALIIGNESGEINHTSYEALDKLSNRIANGLLNNGYKPEDAIAIYMPLNLHSIATYLGIIKAGLVVVSIPDSFPKPEVVKRLELANAKAIITCDGYQYGGKFLNVYERIADLKDVHVFVDGDTELEGHFSFEKLLGNDHFSSLQQSPDAFTNILFSSGTTKAPKAIPWNQTTPIKCASDAYFHQDVHEEDVITWTTGMGWMMAPWLIYAGLLNRATVAVFEGSAALPVYADFLKESRVTILGTIPSLVKNWRKSGLLEKIELSVRLFSSTGEPSNPEDYLYLMHCANFEAPIIEYCGGTEIGGGYITGTVAQPASPASFTSPTLGSSFVLLNGQYQKAPLNEVGEVFIIPPVLGLSQTLLNRNHHHEYYEGQPKGPNNEVLRKHGDAYTQVFVQEFETTYYRCKGRTDDSMNLGGIKISAVEIETILNSHASVLESAAVAITDDAGGPEKLVVFIVGDKTDELKSELQQLISSQLNPLFRIFSVEIVNSLPRTASNKVMRRSLREVFLKKNL